jgi:nucleoside-diphosphate-sugar epimerase
MKVVIVGGTSSVGSALKSVLSTSCEVITAGRMNCDLALDLTWPLERLLLPDDTDVIVHTAAHFGGKTAADIIEAENVNVLGTMKLCQAASGTKAQHFVLVSSIFACLKEDSEHYGAYALSKRHAEDVARFTCATHSLPLAVLRPSRSGHGPLPGASTLPAHDDRQGEGARTSSCMVRSRRTLYHR